MLTRRSRAREVALQLLFQADQNPAGVPRAAVERFARDRLNGDAGLAAFALALFDGTIRYRAEIDPKLAAVAENWRLARMTPVDRNVLRLGSYELLFDPARPPVGVVLDEAIELARRFGGKDSPGFVNGILDRVAKMRNAESGMRNDKPADGPPPPADTPS
jgi:N utilization substance protein B